MTAAGCMVLNLGCLTSQAKDRGLSVKKLSGTKFRQLLRSGEDIPEWFAFKSVVEVLRQHAQAVTPQPHQPQHQPQAVK